LLREGVLGLIVLALIVWLVYVGIVGIVTGHLNLGHSVRHDWFTKPLNGLPAVLAGFSFLCLATAFLSVVCTSRRISPHVPVIVVRETGADRASTDAGLVGILAGCEESASSQGNGFKAEGRMKNAEEGPNTEAQRTRRRNGPLLCAALRCSAPSASQR
jgi:hypothetical protein